MGETSDMPKSKVVSTFEPKVYASVEERRQAEADRANRIKGKLNLIDGYNCEKCLNRGYINVVKKRGENDFEVCVVTCECEKARRSIRNLKASGLEKVLGKYTFDNFDTETDWQKTLFDKAKKYLSFGGNSWFFVGGASGSGKSHICSAISIELLRRNKEVKYMLWIDDSRKIKNDNFDGDGNLIEYYKSVEVLYIDDLFKVGRGYGDDWQRPTQGDIKLAFEILNAREHRGKITIISTEYPMYELFDIDEATAGRIKDNCGEFIINIAKGEGKNYRKRNLKCKDIQ
jgi:DNA replication protein DnaC